MKTCCCWLNIRTTFPISPVASTEENKHTGRDFSSFFFHLIQIMGTLKGKSRLKRFKTTQVFMEKVFYYFLSADCFWGLIIICKKKLLHTIFVSQLRCFIVSWEQKCCRVSVSRERGRFDLKGRFRRKQHRALYRMHLRGFYCFYWFILLHVSSFSFYFYSWSAS